MQRMHSDKPSSAIGSVRSPVYGLESGQHPNGIHNSMMTKTHQGGSIPISNKQSSMLMNRHKILQEQAAAQQKHVHSQYKLVKPRQQMLKSKVSHPRYYLLLLRLSSLSRNEPDRKTITLYLMCFCRARRSSTSHTVALDTKTTIHLVINRQSTLFTSHKSQCSFSRSRTTRG